MFDWALIFFVLAVIAGVLGFGRIAGAAIDISQFLFFVFLVGFLVTVIFRIFRRRRSSSKKSEPTIL